VIFSHVLYQLSYLAPRPASTAAPDSRRDEKPALLEAARAGDRIGATDFRATPCPQFPARSPHHARRERHDTVEFAVRALASWTLSIHCGPIRGATTDLLVGFWNSGGGI
jgi:hypothetical protein